MVWPGNVGADRLVRGGAHTRPACLIGLMARPSLARPPRSWTLALLLVAGLVHWLRECMALVGATGQRLCMAGTRMNMPDTASWLLASFVRVLRWASAFFGGLWWTVRKGLSSSPVGRALVLQAAFLLRTGNRALTGFYFHCPWRVAGNQRLACTVGFLLALFDCYQIRPIAHASGSKEPA